MESIWGYKPGRLEQKKIQIGRDTSESTPAEITVRPQRHRGTDRRSRKPRKRFRDSPAFRHGENVKCFMPLCWLAGLAAGFCLGQAPIMVVFVCIMPLCWLAARHRLHAWLIALTYYLAAARDVPAGAAVFFGPRFPAEFAFLLYFTSSLALSLPWALMWRPVSDFSFRKVFSASTRLLGVFALLTLPPLGLFGWASPLLATGWIFKGIGFSGIPLYCLILADFVYTFRHRRFLHGASLLVIVVCLMCYRSSPPTVSNGWTAIDSQYGRLASGSSNVIDATIRSGGLFKRILETKSPYILTPETVAGPWITATRQYWQPVADVLKTRGQSVIVGSEEYDNEFRYDNTMRVLGTGTGIYRQRFPVPFSMWLPWGGAGTAKAHWLDPGLLQLPGQLAACLICYEQYLPLPVFLTMAMSGRKPDLILATENHWWSRSTSLPAIARQSVVSWAMLFDLPLVTATNI